MASDFVLDEKFHSAFLSILIATLVSAALYSVLYFLVYQVYKLFLFHIKKDKYIGGVWYHLHVKKDMYGQPIKTDKLRAGETTVKQNLYDIMFHAENSYFYLKDGEVTEDKGSVTSWDYVACDWQGENELIACYAAKSPWKNVISNCPFCGTKLRRNIRQGEKPKRLGIHSLTINNASRKNGKMSGSFADEYPSASYGEIFFFRNKADRDALILDVLSDGKLDGEPKM